MLDKLVFLSENKTFAQNYWRDYLNTLKNLMALTVTHSSPSDWKTVNKEVDSYEQH